jgi:hypothetical protein
MYFHLERLREALKKAGFKRQASAVNRLKLAGNWDELSEEERGRFEQSTSPYDLMIEDPEETWQREVGDKSPESERDSFRFRNKMKKRLVNNRMDQLFSEPNSLQQKKIEKFKEAGIEEDYIRALYELFYLSAEKGSNISDITKDIDDDVEIYQVKYYTTGFEEPDTFMAWEVGDSHKDSFYAVKIPGKESSKKEGYLYGEW